MKVLEVSIIPLEDVTDEEFAPYGQIMGRQKGNPYKSLEMLDYWTKNVDLGPEHEKVDYGLLVCNKKGRNIQFFERHPVTSENFVPIEGECIFIMAPPDAARDRPDLSRLKAFYLNGSLGVALHKGNWHWPPIPLEDHVKLVLIRKGESLDPKDIVELKDLGIEKITLKFGD